MVLGWLQGRFIMLFLHLVKTRFMKMGVSGIRKIFLLLVMISTSVQAGWSQSAQVVFIPGTKCSLVPPRDFVAAANFTGFINEASQSSIMVTEMPFSVHEIIAGFKEEDLKAKGLTLLKRDELQFQGEDAVYVHISQDAYGTTYQKHILAFGDSSVCILVSGVFPITHIALSEPIRASILTTRYDPLLVDDPLGSVNFSIDVTGTEFQFTDNVSGSLMYTIDGKVPTERPYFIVGHSVADVNPDDQKQYIVDRFKQLPESEIFIMNGISPVEAGGYNGFELTAYSKGHLPPELLYQVMLFDEDGGYYIMIGSAKEELGGYLEKFRSLIKTFKEK